MRKELTEKLEIPSGVEMNITGEVVTLKKQGNEVSRNYSGFEVKKDGNNLIIHCKSATKREKKGMKTLLAHLKNIIAGLDKKFIYKMQVCAVHFPMNLSVDKAKGELVIKNFLGEVKPRIAKILKGVEVKVEKENITVEGHDKEKTGQTAANIEQAVRITNRDRRVFQDGIYITHKPGDE